MTKTAEKPYLWGCTYLHNPYKGVPPVHNFKFPTLRLRIQIPMDFCFSSPLVFDNDRCITLNLTLHVPSKTIFLERKKQEIGNIIMANVNFKRVQSTVFSRGLFVNSSIV